MRVFDIIWPILVVLVLIIIILKIFRTRQQHNAASNVVFAKYTFSKLSAKQQQEVQAVAKELVLGAPGNMTGFANEVERFGWYALAMKELNIPSQVPENPSWYTVKNPYVAIFPGSYLIRAVSDSLKKNYQLDVHVSEKRNY